MIGRLTGTVAEEADGTLLVDVNGVGYELLAPLGTVGRARTEGGRTTFFVHTHVREDVLQLYGFASEDDRLAFRTLIGVSSVGPKTAVAVLSALPAPELGQAIASRELGRLTSIPGIGKKTAERLLLELKDKLSITSTNGRAAVPVRSVSSKSEMLTSALVNMGYKPQEAERVSRQLGAKLDEGPLPELLREALGLLAK